MLFIPQSLISNFKAGNIPASTFIKNCLSGLFGQLKTILFDGISDVLPLALTVAGAILVVNLGWRLFRNFTKG